VTGVERFYRSVLLAYPPHYRAERGGEMLGVLMDATPPTGRPSLGETASLLWHGVTLRFAGGSRPAVWRHPASAAAVCLSALLTVLTISAASELLASVSSRLTHNEPSPLWLDPLWPVYLLWPACFALLLCRKGVLAAVVAWAAAVTHAVMLVAPPSLLGANRPPAPFGSLLGLFMWFESLAFFVPGLVLALLLLAPRSAVRGVDLITRRRALAAVLAGSIPPVAADLMTEGISLKWGPVVALGILAYALFKAKVLLRGGLLVGLALSYFLLMGFADGSGSRLPDDEILLGLTLGLIPLPVAAVAVLLIRHVESHGFLRTRVIRMLEALTEAARGERNEPHVPERTLVAQARWQSRDAGGAAGPDEC
jgi:hypothetical protein